MTVPRFVACKFKDEYAGDDEKSKQFREQIFQRHVTLYKSRRYVSDVLAVIGYQQVLGEGYHYAILVEFESAEKIAYYDDEDPDHLAVKKEATELFQSVLAWDFPRRD